MRANWHRTDYVREASGPGASPSGVARDRGNRIDIETIMAASRELVRRGDDLSLRAVARDLDVSAPALYRYIDSGADLRLLVRSEIDRDLANHVTQSLLASVAANSCNPLVDVACELWEWAHCNPADFRMLMRTELGASVDAQTRNRASIAFGQVAAAISRTGWMVHPELKVEASASCWLALTSAAMPADSGEITVSGAAQFLALVEVLLHRLSSPSAVDDLHKRVPELLRRLVSVGHC